MRSCKMLIKHFFVIFTSNYLWNGLTGDCFDCSVSGNRKISEVNALQFGSLFRQCAASGVRPDVTISSCRYAQVYRGWNSVYLCSLNVLSKVCATLNGIIFVTLAGGCALEASTLPPVTVSRIF
jgi:hypothetical protein